MTDALLARLAASRMSDASWPGVVAMLGPDWRLVVSSDARRYVLQQLVPDDAGPRWAAAGGKSPSTLERIVAKYGGRVENLASLCAILPRDPAALMPKLAGAVRAKASAFAARDMGHNHYARAVARDGQMRLSVDPDGRFYYLQWVKLDDARKGGPNLRWRRLMHAPTLSEVWAYVRDRVGAINGRDVLRGDDILPRWQALVQGLPERASDGAWPPVPSDPRKQSAQSSSM